MTKWLKLSFVMFDFLNLICIYHFAYEFGYHTCSSVHKSVHKSCDIFLLYLFVLTSQTFLYVPFLEYWQVYLCMCSQTISIHYLLDGTTMMQLGTHEQLTVGTSWLTFVWQNRGSRNTHQQYSHLHHFSHSNVSLPPPNLPNATTFVQQIHQTIVISTFWKGWIS